MCPEQTPNPQLLVAEIFKSIQGESTFQGLPCTFIRLTGCNLRCGYCDTTDSYSGGSLMSIESILKRVASLNCDLIEVTGGEPLMQKPVIHLLKKLVGQGYQVLLETNGSLDLSKVPSKVIKIMDIKCPGSGEKPSFLLSNLGLLRSKDEIKFVLSDLNDYNFAKGMVRRHRLNEICTVLFSPVFFPPAKGSRTIKRAGTSKAAVMSGVSGTAHQSDSLSQALALKILKDKLPVRFQLQLHKITGIK